jgi:hypothetical protein
MIHVQTTVFHRCPATIKVWDLFVSEQFGQVVRKRDLRGFAHKL